jgi:hypothetical protein
MDTLQPQLTTIICGDFNTRIGHRTPHLDPPHPERIVGDTFTCQRASWFISFCEKYELYILNGVHSPAAYTCHTSRGESIVDYVLCNKVFIQVNQECLQTQNLTDHDLLFTHLPLRHGQETPPASTQEDLIHHSPTRKQKTYYKWITGENLGNYTSSAHKWKAYTATTEFTEAFKQQMCNYHDDNDLRAQKI